ncbi:MAG: Ig-like domain-containing protein [Actinomycetota bacterium]|nr:Ig-like domain-containing protein [Actinomycetota bacterium]
MTFSEPVQGVNSTSFTARVAGTTTAVPGTVVATDSTHARFTPTAPLVPGQSYELSLSSAVTSTTRRALLRSSWKVRTSLVVDQTSPAVQTVWDRDGSTASSGGSYAASRTAGARTYFTSTGTVTVLGVRSPAGGLADLTLDGVSLTATTPLSFYSSSTKWQVPVWTRTA